MLRSYNSDVTDLADIPVKNEIGLAIQNKTGYRVLPYGKISQLSTLHWKNNQETGSQLNTAPTDVNANSPAIRETRETR